MKKFRDKDDFKHRVREWAGKMGVKVRALSVRPMRTKWATPIVVENIDPSASSTSSSNLLRKSLPTPQAKTRE